MSAQVMASLVMCRVPPVSRKWRQMVSEGDHVLVQVGAAVAPGAVDGGVFPGGGG